MDETVKSNRQDGSPMAPTRTQLDIVKAVAQFRGVAKYHGAMPRKHAIAYRDEDVTALVAEGLLEWAQFSYGCGKELQGLRLTPAGELLLDQLGQGLKFGETVSQCGELVYEHLLILQDIYHYSRMPRFRRMMPEKDAKYYVPTDFEDLLNRGYVLKMKLKVQGESTLKGYVISGKGEHALAQAKMI